MPIIQSLDRALCILDLFDEYACELKITEISSQMELHKSTVHSLLKTLKEHHYVDQNPENGKYKLGLKLLERGNLVLQNIDIRALARRHLEEVSKKTGQTLHLVIPDGKEGVYIDKVEGAKAVIRYSRIGRRVPLHSSAVGKAMAAFKDPKELRAVLKGYVYTVQTPKTITDEESFLQELQRVRDGGYAVDNQENEPGVQCFAAPIRDHSGQVRAAISISMLSVRVTDQETEQYITMLKQAAAEISKQLGNGFPAMAKNFQGG